MLPTQKEKLIVKLKINMYDDLNLRRQMISYDDIQDVDFLERALSPLLKTTVQESPYELVLLFEDSDEVCDANALIEDTFPVKEADDYRLSTLFCSSKQPLVLACVKKGIVFGVATLSIEDDCAELCCLAVDKNYRNKKIGSVLMAGINDISFELGINQLSLISSPNGALFYESFGFDSMAMRSYQAKIPLHKHIIKEKLAKFSMAHCVVKTASNALKNTWKRKNGRSNSYQVSKRQNREQNNTTFFSLSSNNIVTTDDKASKVSKPQLNY